MRHYEMQSAAGQYAHVLFNKWQRLQKRNPVKPEAFAKTHSYSSWLKFAEWVKRTQIADVGFYIEVMVAMKTSVNLWTHTDMYEAYLRAVDAGDPVKLTVASVDRLKADAEGVGVSVAELVNSFDFEYVHGQLVRRQLTPWLVCCSTLFKEVFARFAQEQQRLLGKEMERATSRFGTRPDAVAFAKTQALRLGI